MPDRTVHYKSLTHDLLVSLCVAKDQQIDEKNKP